MARKLGRAKVYKAHLDLEFKGPNGKKVGKIRVKPNRILWASRKVKGWYGISLRNFASFMETHGSRQMK
jgi:hypothetical protein